MLVKALTRVWRGARTLYTNLQPGTRLTTCQNFMKIAPFGQVIVMGKCTKKGVDNFQNKKNMEI